MEIKEINNCLPKFYLSARKQHGFTFLSLSVREAERIKKLMKKSMLRLAVTAPGEE